MVDVVVWLGNQGRHSTEVLSMTERSTTKYGEGLRDHDWSQPQPDVDHPGRLNVKSHDIEVIYTVDGSKDMGYGREKYKANIKYDDETGEPYVLYVIEYKWKGNYWRDTTDWDFRDIPGPVRQQIAAKLPVERAQDLEPETRLMDEDGESRWQKHHQQRMEQMTGDEMWGTSFLRDALDDLERAAESFDEGCTGERLTEKLITTTQKVIKTVRNNDD